MRDWNRVVREYLDLPTMTDKRDLRAADELAAHLEETWHEALRGGATEAQAEAVVRTVLGERAVAIRDLLGAERRHTLAEAGRQVERFEQGLRERNRRWAIVADLLRDVRLALRSVARRPFFAGAVIVVLALGIGAATTVFTLVDAILLSPLPFPDADRLVAVTHSSPKQGGGNLGTCAAWHLTYQDENRVFDEIGLYSPPGATATITGQDEPEAVPRMTATSGVFRAVGMSAVVGRLFTIRDEDPDALPVALLGHGYWRTRFGADPAVVGRKMVLDGVDRTIVGVLPPRLAALGQDPAVVTALQFRRANLFVGNTGLVGIARLKAGVTRQQAVADMTRMLPMAFEKFPGGPVVDAAKQAGYVPDAPPLRDVLVGGTARLLWVLMATVVLVLLISCANVANLFLVRAEGRDRELTIRAALGAGGGRLVWEHVRESVVLCGLGGVAGLLLAWASLRVLAAAGPSQLPRLPEVSMGPAPFVFGLAVSLGAAAFVAMFLVLRNRGRSVVDALKQGGLASGASRSRQRVLRGLAAVQVAFAFVLLVALGLVMRSGLAVRSVHPGFSRLGDVLALRLMVLPQIPPDVLAAAQPVAAARPTPAAQAQAVAALQAAFIQAQEAAALTQEAIARRLGEIPGVAAVGMATGLPMHSGGNINPLFVEGVTVEGRVPPVTRRHTWVGQGYFETLGIPILAGRVFTWQDVHNRTAAAVVSESLARAYWGSAEAAIGKRVAVRPDPVRWHEVIGVVGEVREDGLNLDPVPMVYWPQITLATFQGQPADRILLWPNVSYAVRSSRLGTRGFLQDVRKAVWIVDRNLPLLDVGPLSGFVAQSWSSTSFALVLLGIAGAVALVLALIGVYGVISYGVSQRTTELGMRMVLGAGAGRVVRMVLRESLAVAGTGTLVGFGLSAWATGAMSSLLFGVSQTDPVTFAAVAVLLAAVALVASYAPARRAARVEPVVVLRAE
jgi:putative ABC transport system permease protein